MMDSYDLRAFLSARAARRKLESVTTIELPVQEVEPHRASCGLEQGGHDDIANLYPFLEVGRSRRRPHHPGLGRDGFGGFGPAFAAFTQDDVRRAAHAAKP